MKKIKYRKISEEMEKLATPEIKNSRVGIGFEDKVKEFFLINIANLVPFKNQARIHFDEGWAIVRQSNTQPRLSMRFEARSAAGLETIQSSVQPFVEAKIAELTNS